MSESAEKDRKMFEKMKAILEKNRFVYVILGLMACCVLSGTQMNMVYASSGSDSCSSNAASIESSASLSVEGASDKTVYASSEASTDNSGTSIVKEDGAMTSSSASSSQADTIENVDISAGVFQAGGTEGINVRTGRRKIRKNWLVRKLWFQEIFPVQPFGW